MSTAIKKSKLIILSKSQDKTFLTIAKKKKKKGAKILYRKSVLRKLLSQASAEIFLGFSSDIIRKMLQ